jgi:hypothetical protein
MSQGFSEPFSDRFWPVCHKVVKDFVDRAFRFFFETFQRGTLEPSKELL